MNTYGSKEFTFNFFELWKNLKTLDCYWKSQLEQMHRYAHKDLRLSNFHFNTNTTINLDPTKVQLNPKPKCKFYDSTPRLQITIWNFVTSSFDLFKST